MADLSPSRRIAGDPEARFWPRVNRTPEGCWLWTAKAQTSNGYGQLRVNGRMVLVHRFAYELLVGPIPEGMQIDHLCRVRRCVNPDHLEPVTNLTNRQRSAPFRPRMHRPTRRPHPREQTHCIKGHPFDEANTGAQPTGRRCRACAREATQRWRQRARGCQ